MDAEKIQNDAGDQQKLVDIRIASGLQICQFQLFHGLWRFRGRSGPKAHPTLALRIHFQNNIVIGLILAAVLIPGMGHQHFMEPQDVALTEIQSCVMQVDRIQRIPVSGDLRFVVVQGGAVLVDDGVDAFITGDDPFNRVGTLYRLHFGDGLKFRKNLCIFILSDTCHGLQRGNAGRQIDKIGWQQAVIQKGIVEYSHLHIPLSYLHIILPNLMQIIKRIWTLSAYILAINMQIVHDII